MPEAIVGTQEYTTAIDTQAWTRNNWTITDTLEPYTAYLNVKVDPFVRQEDLDKFAHKIYKIIEEHTKIDITEDEFMELLKE